MKHLLKDDQPWQPIWLVNKKIGLLVDDNLLVCVVEQNGEWIGSTHLNTDTIHKIFELISTGEIHKYMRGFDAKPAIAAGPIELSCCTGTRAANYIGQKIISGYDYGDMDGK